MGGHGRRVGGGEEIYEAPRSPRRCTSLRMYGEVFLVCLGVLRVVLFFVYSFVKVDILKSKSSVGSGQLAVQYYILLSFCKP